MNPLQRLLLRASLAAAMMVYAASASASLILPNVLFDDPTLFQGTVDVTSFSVESYTFTSANWLVSVREDFIGSEVLPNGCEVRAQHLAAITAGELAPNPIVMSIIFFANSFTPGGPPRGTFSTSVLHAPDALDFLRVSYDPLVAGQSSRISIEAAHEAVPVPEPATTALVGIGLAAIGARRWRERRNS